jgi:pSer/pThr/pTyr-binding forkhead associated (FHA) protein
MPAQDAGSTRMISVPGVSQAGVVGVLIAVDGKIRDEIYKVRDGENRMGRLPSGDVVFDDRDDSISREHALIIHQHGSFGIKPLRESNPTFVNGDQIEGGASLSDGDTIQLGNTTLKFRIV